MKRNIITGALVLAALLAFSSTASAYPRGWGGYRGGYGGYRGYGGYGGYGLYRGGYYGSGFGYGLGTGLLLGSTLGGYGGYGGYGYAPYYGGYSSFGYVPSTTYIAPSTTYVDPYPSYAPSTTYVVPSTTYVEPASPSLATVPGISSRESGYYAPQSTDNTPQVADNTAHLRILAPADAKVWVGGVETGQTGADRSFASPPLTPNKPYTYEVRARWTENGSPVEETRQVKVEANRTSTVQFGRPDGR